ncbi:MAG TPA: tetratricopeptide repeat protein, partial [Spirochaetota bacterium]
MQDKTNAKYIEADEKFEKAESAIRIKDFHQAKVLLKEVIEINPHFVYAYILLARVFWKTGSAESAKKTIEKCISIDRSFGYSYY